MIGPTTHLSGPRLPAVVSLFFLACFVLGGTVLLLQLAFGALGADGHDVDHGLDHDHAHVGLDLLSVRALAAAVGFFGLTGFAVLRLGVWAPIAWLAALAAGGLSAWAVASLMRGIRRLEVDKSLDISRAIGTQGRVHLSIPGERAAPGKVLLTLHDRLLELPAVTDGPGLAAGTTVLITDLESSDTVVVVNAQPLLSEINDVA